MEDVDEFKYLGSVLCKHESMKGEVQEKALQHLGRMMKGRAVNMEIKKVLRGSISVRTLYVVDME